MANEVAQQSETEKKKERERIICKEGRVDKKKKKKIEPLPIFLPVSKTIRSPDFFFVQSAANLHLSQVDAQNNKREGEENQLQNLTALGFLPCVCVCVLLRVSFWFVCSFNSFLTDLLD